MNENIVLDIGNVICSWNPDRLTGAIFSDGSQKTSALDATIRHSDWLLLDRGALSLDEAKARAHARSTLPAESIEALYRNLPESLTPIDTTVEAMLAAHNAGVPIYILSNMQAHAWGYIFEKYEFWSVGSGVVVSCDAGLFKPDTRIYAHLCSNLILNLNLVFSSMICRRI